MFKLCYAALAAAVIAGAIVTFPIITSVNAGTPDASSKSDNIDRGAAPQATATCTQHAWPYYGVGCSAPGPGRQVRIVKIDRL